jgi:hypothetical protein
MQIAADTETNQLLDQISVALSERYSLAEAEALIREYYAKFTDAAYCQSLGIPVQDDDFFFHESAGGMALRIHYYLGLKGDPDPSKFIEWRAAVIGQRA